MLPNPKEGLARTLEAVPEPSSLEPWFQSLPPERRAEMTQQYRTRVAHGAGLAEAERRRRVRETLANALCFLVADFASANGGWWKLVVATLIGAGLGWALSRIDAKRLLSGGLCLIVFYVFETLASGIFGLHLLTSFPLGAACAYLGYRREERGLA